MLMILFWITFILGVIFYFARPAINNAYIGLAPFALFILDIGLLGFKVFGFNL